MNLPFLPPDLAFFQLDLRRDDIDFAFAAKQAAMRPHIVKWWTWDETFQRDLHERRYREKPFFDIRRHEERLGTVSFQVLPEYVRFGEFYLFPAHQGRGTGSAILAHCLAMADRLSLPVRLEYLHWNPVGSLYLRHGFTEIGRSGIHCFMERPTAGL
ncbi:MAG: GNAT family N-acetyltransferase [Janthinobacterium lividum]